MYAPGSSAPREELEGDYVEQDRLALLKARARMSREEALKVMYESRMKLPDGYKFDREEANSR